MKNLQFNPYQCGVRWGRLGLKSLNLSLPCFVVRDYNLTLSLPHHLCGVGKTYIGRSRKGWVKWGEAKLSSLRYLPFVQVLGVHVRCKSHILQDGHAIGMGQNTFPLANISLPLLIVISRVGFKSSHVSILTCLVMYKNLIRFGLFNFYT